MDTIVIATIKTWNYNFAKEYQKLNKDKHNIIIIRDREELTCEYLDKVKPRYVFFHIGHTLFLR